MKIRKKSWHYRLNDLMDHDIVYEVHEGTASLCLYFWTTVAALIKLLVGFGVVCGMLYFTVLCPLAYIFGFSGEMADTGKLVLIVSSTIFGLGFFILGLNYLRYKIQERNSRKEEKSPGLVMSYLKAAKNKVCPLLELEKRDD